ncbi:MAG: elongation factor G [Sarcina sp.]
MKEYDAKNLRNVGIIGHSGVGKTSLVEAFLFQTGVTDRLGKVDDGSTVSDYDSEEKKRMISLGTSIIPLTLDKIKINAIDTPGYFDFIGEYIQGMKAADIGLIVTSPFGNVEVGTEKAWNYCFENKLPRAFFINKLDRENSSFDKTVEALKVEFGSSVIPIQYPIGKENSLEGVIDIITQKAMVIDKKSRKFKEVAIPEEYVEKVEEYRQGLLEAVAETDEVLLDKFFEDGNLSIEEIYRGLRKGCLEGEIAPVMCGSSITLVGIPSLLDVINKCFPIAKSIETDKFSAFVFKTIADPFVGKISIFKVMSGTLTSDLVVLNKNKEKEERITNIFSLRGKSQVQVEKVCAGDIGAISKLQFTETGDTLSSKDNNILFDKIEFPTTVINMAVIPKAKGDEEKISTGLSKLLDEDPSFAIYRDVEHAEMIVQGIGETHIEVIAAKLKNKFGIDVLLETPKVPYRETIKGVVEVQGKHKKQSGGHGQYGDVKIKFEPRVDGEEGLEFVDKVVGGVVPRNYIPAVEKGLLDCMKSGVVGGFPIMGLKATLYDGSYHPVDSSEMAFKLAASIAYKKGLEQAKPILLEPIMKVDVIIPDIYMGDVMGDINKRRGRVLGMEQVGKNQKIIAEIPMAEMFKYATDLRSMTQARGDFEYTFERYDEVPSVEYKKILEK